MMQLHAQAIGSMAEPKKMDTSRSHIWCLAQTLAGYCGLAVPSCCLFKAMMSGHGYLH